MAIVLAVLDLLMLHASFLMSEDIETLGAPPAWSLTLWLVVEGAPAGLLRSYLDMGGLGALPGFCEKLWLVVEGGPDLPGGEQSAASCVRKYHSLRWI